MTVGTFKKLFDALPDGVFAFDDKLRVIFTNAAFKRSFSDGEKRLGKLSDAISCGKDKVCGESARCAYCAFRKTMLAAVREKREQTETVQTDIHHADRVERLALKIRIFPVGEKGKLFLGMTSGSYETEMEKEMLSAKQMQQRLLPAGKSMGGVPYSFMYIPCFEVGGDMPDVYELNGNTYGVLADVSGKGVSAGMLSTFVKAGFDRKQPDLAKALTTLNMKFNELGQDERSYITVAAVGIDRAQKTLRYVSAGHNAPILLKNSLGINEIESPAPPISNWMPDFVYEQKELPFEKGDILVLLTDGITECMNGKGELFGIERVESVLMQSRSAEDFIGKIKAALQVYCGGKFTDDITAIAFDL